MRPVSHAGPALSPSVRPTEIQVRRWRGEVRTRRTLTVTRPPRLAPVTAQLTPRRASRRVRRNLDRRPRRHRAPGIAQPPPADSEPRRIAAPAAPSATHDPAGHEPADDGRAPDGIRLRGQAPGQREAADAVHPRVEIEVPARRAAVGGGHHPHVEPPGRTADDQRPAAVPEADPRGSRRGAGAQEPFRPVREVAEPEAEHTLARVVALDRDRQLAQPVRVVPLPAFGPAPVQPAPAHGPRLRPGGPRGVVPRTGQGDGGGRPHRSPASAPPRRGSAPGA